MTEMLLRYIVFARLPEPPADVSQSGYQAVRDWKDRQSFYITGELSRMIESDIAFRFPTEFSRQCANIVWSGKEELTSVFVRTSEAGYEAVKKMPHVVAVMPATSARSFAVS